MQRIGLVCAILAALVVGTVAAQTAPVSIVADLDPNSATGIRIEGLVADAQGRLYTVDLESRRFFRITPDSGAVETLATLPRPASGMAFDRTGNLYMASGDVILRVTADVLNAGTIDPAAVQTFATGVPGANGLAFDGSGNLYVSGGNTATIYAVSPEGAVRQFATGFVSDRQDQPISTNGLAFGPDGRLYSANTGSGAIDRIVVNSDGTAGAIERFVTNPLLLGADGITFAANGDLYVAANERNAIVRVTQAGEVTDVASNTNAGPLEFPASPAFVGNALYASNFDIARGANAPNDPGVGASIARIDVGVGGQPLPVTQPAPSAPAASPTTVGPTPQPTPAGATPTAAPTAAPSSAPTAAPSSAPTAALPAAPTATPPATGPVTLPNTGAPVPITAIALILGGALLSVGVILRRSRSLQ